MMDVENTVRAFELKSALDRFGGIKVLSLDCFDTILWRKTVAPTDVFYDLQQKPFFQSLGFTASLRINAESRARQLKNLNLQGNEVNLAEIYKESFPHLTLDQLNQLAEEELLTEMESCYAFPPIVELIRSAHKRNIKIIIASDTYFNEKQLRSLLQSTLPADVYSAIHQVFTSCDYGRPKVNGLFANIIHTLKQSAESILHLGDNHTADYLAPRAMKINALHFLHEDECVADILRLQAASGKITDTSIGVLNPLVSPFRGILAGAKISADMPEKLIGYASIGPILYSFAQFICHEIEELQRSKKSVKVAFLMRDAYLPSLACEAFAGKVVGTRIQISRFASYAASFRSTEDIDRYFIDMEQSNRFVDLSRQLLLPEKVSEPIIKKALASANPVAEFISLIHRPDVTRIILNKSAEYRARLMLYLKKELDLQTGDTLVLVDLGYCCTTQRRLTPVFTEMGIEVVGRYLIALRTPGWEHARRGFLDPSNSDNRAMQMLVLFISLFEQLCTTNEKSVIDYDDKGNTICSEKTMSDKQHAKLLEIQSECLRFIRDAKEFFAQVNTVFSAKMFRQVVLSELCRMLFLPTEIELKYLQTFEAEMNLGTNDMLQMFDPEKGQTSLRRRGMFYIEKNMRSIRTNFPAELRAAGFEYTLSFMTQHRLALDFKMKDMALRKVSVPVVFMRGSERHVTQVEAVATHDGYFALWLPAGLKVSIQLGKLYQWFQIESAELIVMEAFIKQKETHNTVDGMNFVALDNITEKDNTLFECHSDSGAVVLDPSPLINPANLIFRLVFRPVVTRPKEKPPAVPNTKVSYSISI